MHISDTARVCCSGIHYDVITLIAFDLYQILYFNGFHTVNLATRFNEEMNVAHFSEERVEVLKELSNSASVCQDCANIHQL